MMLLAVASVVEVELLVVTTTSTAERSSAATEEIGEDVVKVHVMELLASTSTLTLHLFMLAHALFTLLVIYFTLLIVRQYFIRVRNLLELFLRAIGVVLILVWMVLNRQFLEFLFDFCISGISFHAKNFV